MPNSPIVTLITKARRTEKELASRTKSRRELNTKLLKAFGYHLNNAGYVWLTHVRALINAPSTTWEAMRYLTSISAALDFLELERVDASAARKVLRASLKAAPKELSERAYYLSRLTRAALAVRKEPTAGRDGLIYLELTVPPDAWGALKELLKQYVP
jgi:hypothetical protein